MFCFVFLKLVLKLIPLLLYAENQGNRVYFYLGENIWKWRLQSHIDRSAEFDVFMTQNNS
jgi:hypothetical protein